jgi:eukaryotic translation initiation factor 2C
LNDELTALRAAFAKLGDGSWNPPVTFVVAQKRHKTRLFVENPGKDGDGKLGNVPAGTVVDTTICHARNTVRVGLSQIPTLFTDPL